MTTNEYMQLINLASKDLKEAVYTYLSESKKGRYMVPKNCTKAAIKRRITQLRADLLELAKELNEE